MKGEAPRNRFCVKTNRHHNLRPLPVRFRCGILHLGFRDTHGCGAPLVRRKSLPRLPPTTAACCATCGGEIPVPAGFNGLAKTREARELLDRWTSERQTEPARPFFVNVWSRGSGRSRSPSGAGVGGGGVNLEANTVYGSGLSDDDLAARAELPQEVPGASRRFDTAQTLAGPIGAEPVARIPAGVCECGGRRDRAPRNPAGRKRPHPYRIHGSDFNGPNFDIQGQPARNRSPQNELDTTYRPVAGLLGRGLADRRHTLVLWGYFGGPASYAPTGWLTTMAGQMILILGVVTLVSGGMEQTNEDVRVRIERLGERMIRIEQLAARSRPPRPECCCRLFPRARGGCWLPARVRTAPLERFGLRHALRETIPHDV